MANIESILSQFWTGSQPAHGLPADAYRSQEFWDLECDTVLKQNWVCVGFVHELKEVGDVIPVTIAKMPLMLLKNTHGEIGAFHNVCRHRCLTLVDEPKNVGKLIRCPYHAWSYDLAGALRASPHFGGMDQHRPEGFDPAENGLKPVRVAVWHDWIFVNLDGHAPEFEEYAAPLIKALAGMDFSKVEPIGTLDFGEVATNWKFIMENFIEPYHVQFVHPTTTDQPLGDHYTFIDGNCVGSAVDLEEEVNTGNSLAVSSRYLALFPNFILGRYFPDQIGVYLNIPLGPDKMAQKRVLYTTEGQTLSDKEIEALKGLWWDVHKEDHEMCERLQLGRQSPVSDDGGMLSPHWEDSVRAFQELIAKSVAGSQKSTAGDING